MATSKTSSEDTSKPWQSYHTVFTNAKAGMDGVDKEKVQKIVYEMSKGSKYFENEERKEESMRKKIENMRAQCEKLSSADISHFQKIADKRIAELEATRDLSRVWLHVDMDAFYAAVETLSNPSLKGKPMAVGGTSMISTANYEARKYGVRAAMPGFIARKLCPELIFVPTDFEKYTHYSSLTRKVFQRYDPKFFSASLDEAYLDITETCKEKELTSGEVAEELRRSVFEETGLTCSAGIGPNRLLAKVCSDINKPNGQYILPNDRKAVMSFISSLPIRKIGGIGKVTEHILRDVFGIKTCEEMLQKSSFLCALFSQSSADYFLSVGLGLGSTDTPEARTRKSMSNERTFTATNNEKVLYQKLDELADLLSADLQKEGLCGRTLTLKLKTASFEIRSRALTLKNFIWSKEDILRQATKLLKAELPLSVRLIGLRVSHFNEDIHGPDDPTQRSITHFITSTRDASQGPVTGNCFHQLSDAKDGSIDTECNPAISCDHNPTDFLDSLQPSDSFHDNPILSDDAVGMRNHNESPDRSNAELNVSSEVSKIQSSVEASTSRSGMDDDRSTTIISRGVDAASSSLNQQQEHVLVWVDDFKCSVCGFELPPDFVEERQEHSDFHHAQVLQKKFSGSSSSSSNAQRHIPTSQGISSQSRRSKKQKLSSSGQDNYIPIDTFFR